MANSQAILFLLFALDGAIIGILFDFFRILRRSFSTGSILTALEDIIFWISAGIILIYSIFVYNNGIIRGYMFLGAFCGIVLYILTLSNIFIKINVYIINLIKKIINVIIKIFNIPIKIILNIFKKVIFNPILFVFGNLREFLNKYAEKYLNKLKYKSKAKK